MTVGSDSLKLLTFAIGFSVRGFSENMGSGAGKSASEAVSAASQDELDQVIANLSAEGRAKLNKAVNDHRKPWKDIVFPYMFVRQSISIGFRFH